MPEVSLLSTCAVAFGIVFLLLAMLAVLIQLITIAFPVRAPTAKILADPVPVAAISVAIASLFPGARVTRIEEEG